MTDLSMAEKRRNFTKEQKIQILQLAKERGVTRVLDEFKLSYSVYYRWNKNAIQLLDSMNAKETMDELKKLREENTVLKSIIADFALKLEMKYPRSPD